MTLGRDATQVGARSRVSIQRVSRGDVLWRGPAQATHRVTGPMAGRDPMTTSAQVALGALAGSHRVLDGAPRRPTEGRPAAGRVLRRL